MKHGFALLILFVMAQWTFAQDSTGESIMYEQVARIGRGAVQQVIWSPQGDEIAVVTSRGVWFYAAEHLNEGALLFAPDDLNMARTGRLAIGHMGRSLAAMNVDNQITVWDIANGEVLFTDAESIARVQHLAYSPDGSLLMAADNRGWRVWAMPSGERVGGGDYETIDERFRPDLSTIVTDVAFSSDGSRFGIATRITELDEVNSRTYIFESQSGEVLDMIGAYDLGSKVLLEALALNTGRIFDSERLRLDMNQDGRNETIVNTLNVFDVDEDGQSFVAAFPTDRDHDSFSNFLNSIALSPDESRILITDRDNTIRIWDIEEAVELPPCLVAPPTGSTSGGDPIEYDIPGLDSTQCNARWAARVSSTNAHVAEPRDVTTDYIRYVDGAYYSPDNHWRVTERNRDTQDFHIRNLETGEVFDLGITWETVINDVVFTSDGRYAIVAFSFSLDGSDTVIRVWQLDTASFDTAPVATLMGHRGSIESLALSHDESLLLSASFDRTARVWDTSTWDEVAVLDHDTLLWSATFGDDDDTILASGRDGVIYVWRRK